MIIYTDKRKEMRRKLELFIFLMYTRGRKRRDKLRESDQINCFVI